MKINCIRWRNFRGLNDSEIACDGHNVTVSGRNGVGKSSIADILPFVLFGKLDAKTYDDAGNFIAARMPDAEIEFDCIKLRRTVTPRNANRTFIGDEEVSATKFNVAVDKLTGGVGEFLFKPFEFPNRKWQEQRDFLLKHFATSEELRELPVDAEELKRFKREAKNLPARIDELRRQLDELSPVETNLPQLEADLAQAQAQFDALNPLAADRERQFLTEQLRAAESTREKLLQQFRSIKSTCPTCKQMLPVTKIDEARNEIISRGREVAAQVEEFRDKLKILDESEQLSMQKALEIKQLRKRIYELARAIEKSKTARKLKLRLTELTASEKELNGQLAALEGQQFRYQQAVQRQLQTSEDSVNSCFEFVRFKLNRCLANGEVKPYCEAMIEGVPFKDLSKGEKLKASLDILRTFRKKFRIDAPLFLDDAESYTPNSLTGLPNQLFLFKVADSDLRIEVHHDD